MNRIINSVTDLLFALNIGLSVVNVMLSRCTVKNYRVSCLYYANRSQTLINGLDRLTYMLCPLCAAAAGKVEIKSESDEAMMVEPEIDGNHHIVTPEHAGTMPCPATEIRQHARQLFAESMNVK
jgi:hypothetical protein